MMLPYPCSQAGCKEFHPNEHGFCSRHRHSRFFWKVRPTLRLEARLPSDLFCFSDDVQYTYHTYGGQCISSIVRGGCTGLRKKNTACCDTSREVPCCTCFLGGRGWHCACLHAGKAWQAGELALLFSIQALFEARSRFVLVFFGLSLHFGCTAFSKVTQSMHESHLAAPFQIFITDVFFHSLQRALSFPKRCPQVSERRNGLDHLLARYPVLCMMIADSMGLSFGLTFSTTLLVVLASMAYTSGRFDSMRGAMQKLCLAMEASYFQVRKPKLLWVLVEITATCEAFVFVMRQRKEEELYIVD